MTPTQNTPTPGLVAYEQNATVTAVATGAVQNLNPNEYATEAGAEFVRDWLNNDPRTSPNGPFAVSSTDQSTPEFTYNVLLRQIDGPNDTQFDAGLWYGAIQNGGADLDGAIAELIVDTTAVQQ